MISVVKKKKQAGEKKFSKKKQGLTSMTALIG